MISDDILYNIKSIINKIIQKTRNFENKLTLTKGYQDKIQLYRYTSPAKPPLPNRRKLKISDSEGSNSTVSDLDISNVWNYNSEAPTKASERVIIIDSYFVEFNSKEKISSFFNSIEDFNK